MVQTDVKRLSIKISYSRLITYLYIIPVQVYERIRKSGVHEGRTYKVFENTATGVKHYALSQAVADGYPKE